jgi:choline dehydrogenase-like flavoprotein
MLIDIRTLPDGEAVTSDICIIGGGPVGLSLAREFIGTRISVAVIESGGVDLDPEVQTLAEGETEGHRFPELWRMRRRQFGGLSSAWNIQIDDYTNVGVRHLTLDAIDFEKRDWLPYSGWPFDRAHLEPYYVRASAVCGIGPTTYASEPWEAKLSRPIAFPGGELETTMFQFGRSNLFFADYRKELEAAANIKAYLNANVVELEAPDGANSVTSVRIATFGGKTYTVKAKTFILAAGGIENARLMLASNKVASAGLGNQNDLVGRFFIDHPSVRTGLLFPKDPSVYRNYSLYDMRLVDGLTVMGKVTLKEETRRREKLLGISAMMYPRTKRQQSPAHLAIRELRQGVRDRRIPGDTLKLLGDFAANIDDFILDYYKHSVRKDHLYPSLSRGGWSKEEGSDRRYEKFELTSQTEQTPDPENRVVLSETRDTLGSQLPKLHIRWNEADKNSIRRSQQIMVREFAAAGFGRLELENINNSVGMSTHHNMGTTRMHEDPKQGVVDPDGKVHGLANLYVTGGSVFPTGGYANPTLTMVALALRLADHLKSEFGKGKRKRASAAVA